MGFNEKYVECKKCVMNSKITSCFSIDEEGICNYCREYEKKIHLKAKDEKKLQIHTIIKQIKEFGKNKKYDCLIGVSGGRDSSYIVWWIKKQGLRALLVHLDNGWNSELAVKNIQLLCNFTGFDLYTHVIKWEEFRELQKAYFRANVIDIEALTDHAIHALLLKTASKFNIKYIVHGNNIATEAILPKDWVHSKTDSLNILDIVRKNSNVKIKTFPYISFIENLYFFFIKKIQYIYILNYIDYNIEEAEFVLKKETGWMPYKFKHGESLFTRFYQNHILPVKFKVDKRYAHYSTLINSGQITREQAIYFLKQPLYSYEQLKEDKEIFLKKMEMSEEEFDRYLANKPVSHEEYKTDVELWNKYFKLIKSIKYFKSKFFL